MILGTILTLKISKHLLNNKSDFINDSDGVCHLLQYWNELLKLGKGEGMGFFPMSGEATNGEK